MDRKQKIPLLPTLTRIAPGSCQRYYIPVQAEYFSYEGLREFINYVYTISFTHTSIALGGVFVNRFNPSVKKRFSKEIIQSIQEQLQEKFLQTYIRKNIAITQA